LVCEGCEEQTNNTIGLRSCEEQTNNTIGLQSLWGADQQHDWFARLSTSVEATTTTTKNTTVEGSRLPAAILEKLLSCRWRHLFQRRDDDDKDN
jgi:hypothetical protein